jgi:transposase
MMYRVQLTEEQREELQRRTRAADIKPRTRDRLEMIRLLDAGWPIPRIAQHLRVSPRRVRVWVRRFLEGGFDALPDQPHLGQQSQLTATLLGAVRAELAKAERTWTAPQLAAWLEEQHGLCLSPHHLSTLLRRAGLSWRRTERTLQHKQDPQEVEQRRAELQELEKGEPRGAWMSPM